MVVHLESTAASDPRNNKTGVSAGTPKTLAHFASLLDSVFTRATNGVRGGQ
jgi:hypothetical protein